MLRMKASRLPGSLEKPPVMNIGSAIQDLSRLSQQIQTLAKQLQSGKPMAAPRGAQAQPAQQRPMFQRDAFQPAGNGRGPVYGGPSGTGGGTGFAAPSKRPEVSTNGPGGTGTGGGFGKAIPGHKDPGSKGGTDDIPLQRPGARGPLGGGAGGTGSGGGFAQPDINGAAAAKAPSMTPTGQQFTAKGTGYFPDNSPMEGGFKDRMGKPLHTLQDFLAGKAPYVSVAMDSKAFPYGTKLRIPELEKKYGRPIEFRVVDTGGAFKGKGTSRIDICTANRKASLDPTINGKLTLVPQR